MTASASHFVSILAESARQWQAHADTPHNHRTTVCQAANEFQQASGWPAQLIMEMVAATANRAAFYRLVEACIRGFQFVSFTGWADQIDSDLAFNLNIARQLKWPNPGFELGSQLLVNPTNPFWFQEGPPVTLHPVDEEDLLYELLDRFTRCSVLSMNGAVAATAFTGPADDRLLAWSGERYSRLMYTEAEFLSMTWERLVTRPAQSRFLVFKAPDDPRTGSASPPLVDIAAGGARVQIQDEDDDGTGSDAVSSTGTPRAEPPPRPALGDGGWHKEDDADDIIPRVGAPPARSGPRVPKLEHRFPQPNPAEVAASAKASLQMHEAELEAVRRGGAAKAFSADDDAVKSIVPEIRAASKAAMELGSNVRMMLAVNAHMLTRTLLPCDPAELNGRRVALLAMLGPMQPMTAMHNRGGTSLGAPLKMMSPAQAAKAIIEETLALRAAAAAGDREAQQQQAGRGTTNSYMERWRTFPAQHAGLTQMLSLLNLIVSSVADRASFKAFVEHIRTIPASEIRPHGVQPIAELTADAIKIMSEQLKSMLTLIVGDTIAVVRPDKK